MPPRLLSADTSEGKTGQLARSYGFVYPVLVMQLLTSRYRFVDTVHGLGSEGSIWTDNRYTGEFAAMPSMHFGYSLLIGLTIVTIPLNLAYSSTTSFGLPLFNYGVPSLALKITVPSCRRLACMFVGALYPTIVLVAIIATANHFILDAVAGGLAFGVAWWGDDAC
jgi:hypothetical protein